MGGRIAKPAALKLVEGRSPGRDSGGRVVKKPAAYRRLAPVAPEWLSGVARAEWDRVLPELMRLELTKELDAAALATYCETWALFVAASKDVHEHGLTVTNFGKDSATWTTANPSVGIQQKAASQLRSWCSEFGFTPSSEQKVAKAALSEADDDSPFG